MTAFAESPLPDGAFNFVTGGGSTVGFAVVEHERIRFVAFTGGTDVGQYIASTVPERSAECLLELGGNDPVLVLDAANVEAAAESVVFGSNYNCGQCCSGTECVIATRCTTTSSFVDRWSDSPRFTTRATRCLQKYGCILGREGVESRAPFDRDRVPRPICDIRKTKRFGDHIYILDILTLFKLYNRVSIVPPFSGFGVEFAAICYS